MNGKFRLRGILAVVAAILIFIFAVTSGCGKKQTPPPAAIPVTTGKAELRDMPVQIESVGNVVAFNSVVVLPQVTGRVKQVHFKEGQDVKVGDLLVTIDTAPFEQKLAQVQAQLERDVNQANFAVATGQRYETLFQQGAVSRQEYEQSTSSARAQTATVQQSRAAVESARIDLDNCSIRSPINGRTGAILANLGALANTNTTQLVVINQIEPIFVSFTVQEKELAGILAAQAKGPLQATANVTDRGLSVADGILTFVDNTVSTSAGVIQLKAQFPNQKRELWPGQFVRITLLLNVQPNAVVLPAEAVCVGRTGKYVFIVKDDMTVEARPVEQDRVIDKLAVITKGVNAGETVVTDGQVNLRDGAKVSIKGGGSQ